MDSIRIYEESKEELLRVRNSLSSNTVSINLEKLDDYTKGKLITAIQNTISDRLQAIDNTYLGVQKY